MDHIGVGYSFKVYAIELEPELKFYYQERLFTKGTTWTLQEKTPDDSVYTLTNGKVFLAISGTIVSKIKVIPHY